MTATSRRIVLAARPTGMVDETTTRLEHVEAPHPAPGQALVWVRYLSIDPTIRGWISHDTYLPAVSIGDVVRSGGTRQLGRIRASAAAARLAPLRTKKNSGSAAQVGCASSALAMSMPRSTSRSSG